MKTLQEIVKENFKFKINRDNDVYAYHPTTFDELRQIIEERNEELGTGTLQEPINFNDIDVSGMITFYDEPGDKGICEYTNFEYIDISGWDVSNITNMHNMFSNCNNLKSVGDLSNWDVSSVKDISRMFRNCFKLESIGDLSHWDVSNVENTSRMFINCYKLESVGDLSKWDVSSIKDMCIMFSECKNLKSIGDISNWDISNVIYMNNMFENSGITNTPKWYVE